MRRPALLRLLAAIVAVLSFSCAATRPASERVWQRKAQFVEAEYAPYDSAGGGSISGQAFATTRGGEVKLAAGSVVFLNPATSYSEEWFTLMTSGIPTTPPDQRVPRYTRSTVVGADGRFRFDGLPPGRYYLWCRFGWERPSRGLMLRSEVNLGWMEALDPNEHADIIMRPVTARNSQFEGWSVLP